MLLSHKTDNVDASLQIPHSSPALQWSWDLTDVFFCDVQIFKNGLGSVMKLNTGWQMLGT